MLAKGYDAGKALPAVSGLPDEGCPNFAFH
jgi:hypothetical protein